MAVTARTSGAGLACLALGVALAVIAVAGCGGGGEERPAAPAASQAGPGERVPPERDPPLTGGGDRAAAEEVVSDVQNGFLLEHGGVVCFELSEALKERLVGPAGGPPRTCEDAIEAAIRRWYRDGEAPFLSEVEGVEIDGDVAFVALEVPDRGRYRVRVVRDGSWKLPELDLDRPPGLELLD